MKPLKPIYTGNARSFVITYTDADGNVVDVTGYTAKLVIKKDHYTPTLVEVDADVGTTDGLITFNLSAADTAGLLEDDIDKGEFLIAANVTKPSSDPIILFQTSINVIKGIV